ncbi:MAG TPA: hypothetical protein VE980_18615 [Pyrinomonadaceae bacterium]|nr:hypothetical protein [Pyrinomonadaceae bacterium]
MLGTLLEKIGTLLPRNFIIANFFPMLLFAAINGLMLYWMSDRFHLAVQQYFAMDAGDQALIGFPILIAITLAAYIFSAFNLFQREILEGRYGPTHLKDRLAAGQQRRANRSADKLEEAMKYERRFRRLDGVERLRLARVAGRAQGNPLCVYTKERPAALLVAELEKKRLRYRFIETEQLEDAIVLLGQELRQCAVNLRDPARGDDNNKILLDRHQTTLKTCLDYAKKRNDNDLRELFNAREFNYSRFKTAPTAMGNIAESVRGYARSRYAMNLDPFWSRLQKILIDDEKFYATLVDAKTQLDFMISLFWVTVSFTGFWTIALFYLRRSLLAFLLVAVGGPVLSILWYKIALQNYRAFADICRTSVDLYRFKLLDMLHVERPGGNLKERRTWVEINKVIGYGEETVIRYQYPPPPKS